MDATPPTESQTSTDEQLAAIEKKAGHLIVLSGVALLIVAVVVTALLSHWFAARLGQDFWPIDRSAIAPNLLASLVQAVGVVAIMAFFYPPMRRAVERAATRHKEELKAHITSELALVHAKMDHIIEHHPDIPAFEP